MSSATTGSLLDGIAYSLEAGRTNILIDFQQVMFMDSTGLSALVMAMKRVRQANGRFALCRLNGQARMVLEHSGMNQVFTVYETPAEFSQAIADDDGEPAT